MKLINGLWLTLLTFTATVAGADGPPPRTDINPALLYYQAFILGPNLDATNSNYLFWDDWRGQKLPDKFGKLIGRYDQQFALVRQAAHSTVPCDWGLDFSRGLQTWLPHLSRMKLVAQTAQLRALWDLQNDRPDEARDDLLAAFTMARNTSRDGTVVGVLVQVACEAIIFSSVAANFGRFSPETLQQLVDGFDAAPPYGTIAAAIPSDKAIFNDGLIYRIHLWQKENPGRDAVVMAKLHDVYNQDFEPTEAGKTNGWEKVAAAAGGTSDGILKLIHEEEPFFNRYLAIAALPAAQYETQMAQFKAEYEKTTNPFIALSLPSLKEFWPREFRIQTLQAMVRAAVAYRLHGEAGLQGVKDPCGNGPFTFQRFVFQGVDRGFKLSSDYKGGGAIGFPVATIFVEKDGPPFIVEGSANRVGQPVKP